MHDVDSSAVLVDKHFLHRGTSREFEMEVDYIREALPPGVSPLADIGCGIGALFDKVETDYRIGIDYLVEGLLETRRRHPSIPLVCADAGALPLRDASIEAIVTQHLIEHIADGHRLLRDWRRVLRPGGWLVILTPNKQFADHSVFHDDTHVHIYDSKDLANVLRTTGFVVQDVRTIGIDWFRNYHRLPSAWRFRRYVLKQWKLISTLPGMAGSGQTLCATARRDR